MTDTGETAEFSLKTPSVPVSWIYSLPKEKLIKVLEGMDQDTAGTVDELRKRLSTFLKTNPTQTSSRPTSPTPPTTDPTQRDTTMAVCEKVRKWGLNFDGVGDAISFLERIQELRECCDITGGDLLKALPLLFRGNAILWYRNNKEFWTSWEDFLNDFKTQYLPPRYDYLIEEEIRARHQRPTESFQAYLTAILTLMRRGKALNDSERVERVYRNMRPEYKLYARRDAFKTLKELAALAAEYELIQRESRMAPGYALGATNPRRPEQRVQAAPATNVARENDHQQAAVLQGTRNGDERSRTSDRQPERLSNPRSRCWRCGREGHTRMNCRNRSVLFCSRCGLLNVASKDCRCQGNASLSGSRG